MKRKSSLELKMEVTYLSLMEEGLKHTIFHGLHLVVTRNLDLNAFCAADWGGDNVDWKSTGAYIVYLGPNTISWSCKKQSTGEYRSIGTTTSKLLWIQQLLMELRIQIPK